MQAQSIIPLRINGCRGTVRKKRNARQTLKSRDIESGTYEENDLGRDRNDSWTHTVAVADRASG